MLSIENLHKRFGNKEVLKGLNFEIRDSEIVGFVGRNGSGKTTTMRSIMNLLNYEKGNILFRGSPVSDLNRNRLGYMPEERGLFAKQDVTKQILYFAQLQGMQKNGLAGLVRNALEEFELSGEKTTLGKLSLGNQQRIQIIVALIHNPELLILDEPFSGLDPLATTQLLKILQKRVKEGKSVIFSSHQLSLVEQVCQRILILDEGQIIADDSIENLRKFARVKYRILSKSIPNQWSTGKFFQEISRTESEVVVEFERGDIESLASQVLNLAITFGPVMGFEEIVPTLAEIYEALIIQ